jgi:hypothetical protein
MPSDLLITLKFFASSAPEQIACGPNLPHDSGNVDMLDLDHNKLMRLMAILDDLYFIKEFEDVDERQARRGISTTISAEQLAACECKLKYLNAIFELLRESHKPFYFTQHGLKNAAVWELVREIARAALTILGDNTIASAEEIHELLSYYEIDAW